MIRASFTFALFTVAALGQGTVMKLPVLDRHQFSPRDLVESANALIAAGEAKAVTAILARADGWSTKGGFQVDERLGWLCRLAWEAKGEKPLRQPAFGGLALPYRSMPLRTWPRYPVAIQDGVPLILAEGYTLAGQAESMKAYVAHCRKHGRFRTKAYASPDRKSATNAVESLLKSKRWTAIKWKHEEKGLRYEISESWRKDELRKQAQNSKKA